MVSDAAATKAPIAKIADRVSGVFVPAVMTIAVLTIIGWLLGGQTVGFALARGISVLVISCPCALGLATPVAIMVGNGMGAKNGILFKNAVSLENAGRTEIVALDKTGTITSGEPKVTDLFPTQGISERELLRLAAGLEAKSEHPLARAVMERAKELSITYEEAEEFTALPGNGLAAAVDGKRLVGGSMRYVSGIVSVPRGGRGTGKRIGTAGKDTAAFCNGRRVYRNHRCGRYHQGGQSGGGGGIAEYGYPCCDAYRG